MSDFRKGKNTGPANRITTFAKATKVTPSPTKADKRNELEREIERYLNSGGEVKNIPNGQSGNELNVNLFSRSATFAPKAERTPLNDVVKELEERKKAKPVSVRRNSGPKKKLLRDDFGEPIRWVWDDGKDA